MKWLHLESIYSALSRHAVAVLAKLLLAKLTKHSSGNTQTADIILTFSVRAMRLDQYRVGQDPPFIDPHQDALTFLDPSSTLFLSFHAACNWFLFGNCSAAGIPNDTEIYAANPRAKNEIVKAWSLGFQLALSQPAEPRSRLGMLLVYQIQCSTNHVLSEVFGFLGLCWVRDHGRRRCDSSCDIYKSGLWWNQQQWRHEWLGHRP